MKKINLLVFVSLICLELFAQRRVISTFDNHYLPSNSITFGDGKITHYKRAFTNSFDSSTNLFTGFALSNFTNSNDELDAKYTSIKGAGVSFTPNYLTLSHAGVVVYDSAQVFTGFYFCPTRAMHDFIKNGNGAFPKFGKYPDSEGDFLELVCEVYRNGEFKVKESMIIADFRENKQFILEDWTNFIIPDFQGQTVDKVKLFLRSSRQDSMGQKELLHSVAIDDWNGMHIGEGRANFPRIDNNSVFNGKDGSDGFCFDYLYFPNNYNAQYDFWSGWSASTIFDDTTKGFLNQYSPISIFEDPNPFDRWHYEEESFISYGTKNLIRTPYTREKNHLYKIKEPTQPMALLFNNTTYSYYSMLEGSQFNKKFGGADGTDPDYFRIILTSIDDKNVQVKQDTIYLADFRSTNASDDYIAKDWIRYELGEKLANERAHVIKFELQSSDTGQYGMNNPAYFAMKFGFNLLGIENIQLEDAVVKVYPNPTNNSITIASDYQIIDYQLFDITGSLVKTLENTISPSKLSMDKLNPGMYFLKIQTEAGWITKKIFKN